MRKNIFLAPAKLNLMLKVLNKRDDGYHNIESIFCLINICDEIKITKRNDKKIIIHSKTKEIKLQDNIIFKAVKLLQSMYSKCLGVNIYLKKNIPLGAGLGGGSSDAATTLMALNFLYKLNISKNELIKIGNKLGSDVPFFIFGNNAFVKGTGNILKKINIPKKWYVILKPNVNISTKVIFNHKLLTRNSTPSIIHTLENKNLYHNDMQKVVIKDYPEVKKSYFKLNQYGKAIMTGTGSCFFLVMENYKEALKTINNINCENEKIFCVKSLNKHPEFLLI